MEALTKAIRIVYVEKYKKKSRIYRGVDRTPSDSEVLRLISVCENLKYKTIFYLLAFSGLRIGECVQLKLKDIDFQKRTLRVNTEKQKKDYIDIQPLPKSILPHLELYTRRYKERIERSSGWLFPQRVHTGRPVTHATVRKKFAQCREDCNLNKSYAIANDAANPVQKRIGQRNLHEFTLHSFRHWYKYKLDKAGTPYGLIRTLMRHKGGSVTDGYGHYGFKEKRDVVDKVFKDFLI